MTPVVVDADVVSFLFKNHPIARRCDPDLEGHAGLLSFVPSSPDLCRKWAEVMVAARAAGRRIECADAWIAATALLYRAPLLTHNCGDYVGVPELDVISLAE
jgi:predicted nucleic acid-binding protein